MISPVSSGAAAYVQNAQVVKPQTAPTSTSQSSGSSSTEDKVELSAQAKAASSNAPYTAPSTVMAKTNRAEAAS